MAIRLPASVVQALNLREGDDIEVAIADDRLFEVLRKPNKEDIFYKLKEFRGLIPVDFKFDRDEANAR